MCKEKSKYENIEGAWAAAGFSFVLIIIGLPVWWTTTTVYRANLPYSNIDELSSYRSYHTLNIRVISEKAYETKKNLDDALLGQSKDNYIKFLISSQEPDKKEKEFLNKQIDLGNEDFLSNLKHTHTGSISIYFMNAKSFITPEIFITSRRSILVKNNVDLNLLIKTLNSIALDDVAKDGLLRRNNLLNSIKNKDNKVMRQVPTEAGYDITLTLMLPQPHLMIAEWDVKKAVETYLEPIAKQLEDVIQLRIRSQILYMTSMKISPKWSSEYKHYALAEQQLPITINAIEAKLGSFVSTRPSLHFVVYIPNQTQSPLHIHTTEGLPISSNSFLVPRWGGVIIYNPPKELLGEKDLNITLPQNFVIDSQWVMSIIISQLHKLFPIPSINSTDGVVVAERIEDSTRLLTDWQLDGLSRARVLAYLSSIRITLQSLCDLVGEIGNMVVSDEVAGWVWSAASDWRACLEAASEGRLNEATIYCKDAFVNSDAAFFHPSMLALLYFPDNQKYAIYVPLFLPVSIPVVLSLKMIMKLLLHSRKKKEKIN